jgi:ABC-type sugar transport system substrate-binding protein
MQGRLTTVALVGAVAALALAGCSSSRSSGAGPGAGSSTDAVPVSGGDTTAQAFLQKYVGVPTSINLTVPLQSAPAKGKTVFFVGNTTANGLRVVQGVQAGAAALGWKMTVLNADPTNPSTGNSAILQAVQAKPDFIGYLALPAASVTSGLAAAKSAGIPAFPVNVAEDPSDADWRFSNPFGAADFGLGGKVNANYVVSHSASDAKVLVVGVPSIANPKVWEDSFNAEMTSTCPKCVVHDLDVQYSAVLSGAVPGQVVSYLRANPAYKQVVFSVGAFTTGFAVAAKAGGLTLGTGQNNIKVTSYSVSPNNLSGLKAGTEQMSIALALPWTGWVAVDAMARYDEHMSLAPNWSASMPIWLQDKASVTNINTLWDGPVGYQDQFKKLWLVG